MTRAHAFGRKGETRLMNMSLQAKPRNVVAMVALSVASAALLMAVVATGILFVFLSDARQSVGPLIPVWVIGSSSAVGCSVLVACGSSVAGFVRGVRSRHGWMAAAAIPVAIVAVAAPILVVGTAVRAW
jgi:hypothetical protein